MALYQGSVWLYPKNLNIFPIFPNLTLFLPCFNSFSSYIQSGYSQLIISEAITYIKYSYIVMSHYLTKRLFCVAFKFDLKLLLLNRAYLKILFKGILSLSK